MANEPDGSKKNLLYGDFKEVYMNSPPWNLQISDAFLVCNQYKSLNILHVFDTQN